MSFSLNLKLLLFPEVNDSKRLTTLSKEEFPTLGFPVLTTKSLFFYWEVHFIHP
uniref:Uncharacterized protein n=1 Tax=Utricularia reniformis TaxID=192314 RepID=A0A1Y0B215_9LAMI|nr:hypothetical protein AEK19_MT1282 [Utricularia reniformis]ART31486.1 hypothetical protein AEK19_MT1282 [Utricularia reniformis]